MIVGLIVESHSSGSRDGWRAIPPNRKGEVFFQNIFYDEYRVSGSTSWDTFPRCNKAAGLARKKRFSFIA